MSVLVISNVTAGEFKIDIVQFIDLTDWIGNLFHLSISPGKNSYLWSNLPPRTTIRRAEDVGIDDYKVSIYNNVLPL